MNNDSPAEQGNQSFRALRITLGSVLDGWVR